jgi:serine/threonine-protein kinase RsbW
MVQPSMTLERWDWSIEEVIPSKRGAGRHVIEEVLERLSRHRWSSHDIFGVRLALEEAIVNAIKHGNGSDANKLVRVVCKVSQERFWVEVADEGRGFDPADVPDPTDPARLDAPNGRGIMLMKNYMNRVEYNDRGNIVTMEKQRAAAN